MVTSKKSHKDAEQLLFVAVLVDFPRIGCYFSIFLLGCCNTDYRGKSKSNILNFSKICTMTRATGIVGHPSHQQWGAWKNHRPNLGLWVGMVIIFMIYEWGMQIANITLLVYDGSYTTWKKSFFTMIFSPWTWAMKNISLLQWCNLVGIMEKSILGWDTMKTT